MCVLPLFSDIDSVSSVMAARVDSCVSEIASDDRERSKRTHVSMSRAQILAKCGVERSGVDMVSTCHHP